MSFDVAALVAGRLATGGDADQLHFNGRWRSWRWIAAVDEALSELIGSAPTIGLIARTRPHHVAVFAGSLARRRIVSMIYSAQSPAGMAEDVRRLRLPAIVADRQDWSPEVLDAAREAGSAAIAITDDEDGGAAVSLLLARASGGPDEGRPDVALELLSSGTTGPPKRVPLAWTTLNAATEDAANVYGATASLESPQVMTQPLGNVTGIAYVVPPLCFGRRIVLLEKFEPHSWAAAVREHRPVRVSLPPAAIRMVLDAGIARDDLSSLGAIGVGGGKVDADVHARFEEVYGIPILHAFGATEFGGVVANWTIDLYRQFGAAKRGSPGRASTNVQLRIVDQDSFAPLGAGETGLLEAKVDRMGPDWLRTNDLASIDADGFLFLHGRADGAINRGGFKVVPDVVAEALKAHPAVADAAVVGIDDGRLGQVPVAAVELAPGASAHEDELMDWAKQRLLSYQRPVKVRILAALPRNASLKISAPDVKALFA